MTNNQETNTTDVEKAFEELWKKDFIPSPYGVGNGFYSPASLAVSRRKEAARIIYKEAFTAGARSRDEEIEQLKDQLREAVEVIRFYGKPQNWTYDGHDFRDEVDFARQHNCDYLVHIKKDLDHETATGGKRARQFLTKHQLNSEEL